MRSSRPLWPVCGPAPVGRNRADQGGGPLWPGDLGLHAGAGEGNRTLMTSLEGCDCALPDQHLCRSPVMALPRQ